MNETIKKAVEAIRKEMQRQHPKRVVFMVELADGDITEQLMFATSSSEEALQKRYGELKEKFGKDIPVNINQQNNQKEVSK